MANTLQPLEPLPYQFAHITEKGAALISTAGGMVDCHHAHELSLTRTHKVPIEGIFSDAITSCIIIALYDCHSYLFVCHQNRAVDLNMITLPPSFKVARAYVAFDPRLYDPLSLKRALAFVEREAGPSNVGIFDRISHQACGFGVDGRFYRLNTNVRFDGFEPSVDTQDNCLCGIRMADFENRRAFNNRNRSSSHIDLQFDLDHFVGFQGVGRDKAFVWPEHDHSCEYEIESSATTLGAYLESKRTNRRFAPVKIIKTAMKSIRRLFRW